MYSALKSIIKSFLPSKFLFKIEPIVRYFHSYLYMGFKFECNICNFEMSRFIEDGDHQICASCGSIGRVRRLWEVVQDEFSNYNQLKILDFSPSRCFYRKLHNSNNQYFSSYLSGDFIADYQYDITKIDQANDTFDLIFCYHILEHIEKDTLAIQELFRILRQKGTCIIQTPFKTGAIYENSNIKTPEGRLEHFGQADHVRIYSVEGLKQRLEAVGFTVEIKTYEASEKNKNCFNTNETILFCTK